MAFLGEEVADAYISVHADTTAFRRDMAKLKASSSSLFDEIGQESGRAFQRAVSKEFRGVSLRNAIPKLRAQMSRLTESVKGSVRVAMQSVEGYARTSMARVETFARDAAQRVGVFARENASMLRSWSARTAREVVTDFKILGGGFNLYVSDPVRRAFDTMEKAVGGRLFDQLVRLQGFMRTLRNDARILGGGFNLFVADPIRRAFDSIEKAVGGRVFDQLVRLQGFMRTLRNDARILGGGFNLFIADPLRDVASVIRGQLSNQMLRMRVLFDRGSDSLRTFGREIANTVTNMGFMLSPGGWDQIGRDMRRGLAGIVPQVREGWVRAWNSDMMVAFRRTMNDLVDVSRSGLAALDGVTDRAFLRMADRVQAGGQKVSDAFGDMWSRITRRNKEDGGKSTEAVQDVMRGLTGGFQGALFPDLRPLKDMVDGVQDALFDLADTTEDSTHRSRVAIKEFSDDSGTAMRKLAKDTETHSDRAGKAIDTRFIGRLKGGRNDAVNAIGIIGGAFENLVSTILTGGFKLVGSGLEKIGGVFTNAGEGFGPLQGPIVAVGGALVRAGAAMGTVSATGVGLVIVLATLAASFVALGAAAAIVSTLLSALTGIVVALAASLAYAISGVLLPLGPMALSVAAGIGALVVAFKDLSDEQKAAFDPLKTTFKNLQTVVRQELFKNLASQIDGLNGILRESVAPLLIGAASALSGVIDYMIAAFNREEVKASLATLAQTLPGILSSLGGALTDFVTGIVGFIAALSPKVADIASKIGAIASRFSEWANSAEGQSAIKDFFDKASESAGILWGVILKVWDALKILFADGKSSGDQMIAKIGEIIAKFTTWAQDDANRQKVKDWFDQAKTVAGQLYDAVVLISDSIKKLDTPENRKALQSLLSGINGVLAAVNWLSGLFKNLPGLIEGAKNVFFSIPGLGTVVALVERLVAGIKFISGSTIPNPSGGNVTAPGPSGGSGGALKAGGILNSPTRILAGEAGREMVVPLVRPLNQVDASVRAVSAFARGMDNSAFNGGVSAGKVVNIASGAVQVTAATDNEEQVANAVLDRLVARWK